MITVNPSPRVSDWLTTKRKGLVREWGGAYVKGGGEYRKRKEMGRRVKYGLSPFIGPTLFLLKTRRLVFP